MGKNFIRSDRNVFENRLKAGLSVPADCFQCSNFTGKCISEKTLTVFTGNLIARSAGKSDRPGFESHLGT